MTKLLEQVIAKARELPEAAQDEAAEMLLAIISRWGAPVRLDDETRKAVRAGLEQARRGEFATDEEVAAVFNRYRK